MKIMLTGRDGQVGWELERALPALGELAAFDRAGLDLADTDAVVDRVRELRPQIIVNAAAYTAVDQAESERDKAFAINARAPGILAAEAKKLGAVLVHYSTDYVFDGAKTAPYDEDDAARPVNTYGESKLEGERAVQAAGGPHLILRCCWVYGRRGRNFLLTMLRLARERTELKVVDDQFGSPTWCRVIAQTTLELLQRRAHEQEALLHLACGGYASWFDFATAIVETTRAWRDRQPAVMAIPSSAYATAAPRPASSRLSTGRLVQLLGHGLPEWQESLAHCLADSNINA